MSCRRPQVCNSSARARREQDEDLILFREMFKRERERNMSLLQPDSVELEPGQGTYLLNKIPSGKSFLSTESGKNDYDWLKTPPATPLFPSLEMEANHPNMVIHKELPLLHPFKPSRFKGKSEETKPAPKSPNSTSASSSQSVTPRKGSDSSSEQTAIREGHLVSPIAKLKQSIFSSSKRSNLPAISAKPATAPADKQNSDNNRHKNTSASSLLRSRTPTTIPGFCDEAPPNLKTTAVTVPNNTSSNILVSTKSNDARDRKAELGRSNAMKEKVMNARRAAVAEKDSKPKDENGVWKLNVGFGKSKPGASHDNAHNHMDNKNTPGEVSRPNSRHAKNSSHHAPDKEAKKNRGQLDKHTPKSGAFLRRAKRE